MQYNHGLSKFVLIPAVVLAAACGRDNAKPDDALRSDLSLANQTAGAPQIVSPAEQPAGYAPYGQQPVTAAYAPAAPAPRVIERVVERPVYRTRSASSSAGQSSGGSGTVYRAPAAPIIEKHQKRDAAIGAAAGAAIGVATSARKDRLKGGLLGAVAGGALGAVIGNNVDKTRRDP